MNDQLDYRLSNTHTYEGTIRKQFESVSAANVVHTMQRARVNQGEL